MVPGARLVILGKQGAGKGTQCSRLARHYVVPHISTGDMFRAAVRQGTEFGKKAKEYMEAGELVPDEVVIGVVGERLEQDDTGHRGFILDGFPRNVMQAEALDQLLAPVGLDLAIDLEVPTGVVLKRLASRRVCTTCGTNYSTESPPANEDGSCDVCGGEVIQREDDTERAIARRLVPNARVVQRVAHSIRDSQRFGQVFFHEIARHFPAVQFQPDWTLIKICNSFNLHSPLEALWIAIASCSSQILHTD